MKTKSIFLTLSKPVSSLLACSSKYRSGIGYFLLFCIITLVTSCSQNSPSAVVKSYQKACIANDYDKAITMLYFKGSSIDINNEDSASFIKGLLSIYYTPSDDNNITIVDFKIKNETIDKTDPNKALVDVELIKKDGTIDKNTSKCIKIDGKWYVDSGK